MGTSSAAQILAAAGPACRDTGRRARLLAQSALNGIDAVEFEFVAGQPMLHVHFLLPLPADAYGLVVAPGALQVHGGTRIAGIVVTGAALVAGAPHLLDLTLDRQGDYSPYLLAIGWTRGDAGLWEFAFAPLDRLFSLAPINFRPGCLVDFDCAATPDCPPDTLPEPLLDYLARDYASLRQMLLDLVAQRNPRWTERSAADIGMALLELFAHEGDHISYFQDAVANEAYLDTARQRDSVKRHARLVDYAMHDGCNAWTWVHYAAATPGTVGPGVQLVTRIGQPLRFDRRPGVSPPPQPVAPPGARLNPVDEQDYLTDPALAQVRVFETAASVRVDPLNNALRLHAWGNDECCLARGATSAHLYAVDRAAGVAVRPPLAPGDYLLLEEVAGPLTGAPADADPAHRQVVRIRAVGTAARDGLFLAALDASTFAPLPVTAPVPPALTLPLLAVVWEDADGLTFPLCLAARRADGRLLWEVSVARGNIGLADHGRSVLARVDFAPPLAGDPGYRLRLDDAPLTMQRAGDSPGAGFPPLRERPGLAQDVERARPAVALQASRAGAAPEQWLAVPDLLSSAGFDPHFVADVDNLGRAVLRFGDGEYGKRLSGVERLDLWYRIGNGGDGNIGAEALAHVVEPVPPPGAWPRIEALRNPLPARGGAAPELIEEVRQYAPAAFRAHQLRAVTEHDYAALALTIDGVAGAVARFRWTGSWYTVFVGIDPVEDANVLTGPRGVARLAPVFERRVRAALERYRLAGYDLEIRAARYVPLDVTIELCARPGYFGADVAHAVALALSAGRAGFFSSARFGFGEPVHLSRLYAAIEAVDGVESALVKVFRRHGRAPAGELEGGVIPIGAWEIARLDNDPSNMENGTLTILAGEAA